MRWALDHWDEAAPDLLTVLERLADGTDRSEEAASGAFFVATWRRRSGTRGRSGRCAAWRATPRRPRRCSAMPSRSR